MISEPGFTAFLGAMLLMSTSAHSAVTITYDSFASPIANSTPSLSATDGDSTATVTSAALGVTGLTVEAVGGNIDLTAINSSYVDYVSIDFETSTTVSVTEVSFFYDFVNGTRGNRFTQVTVNLIDPNDGITVLDSVTLAENNTGNTDNATITQAVSGLDAGTQFQVQYFLRSSETWGDQDMDNLSLTMTVVPEPSSVMLLSGMTVLGLLRRRRQA